MGRVVVLGSLNVDQVVRVPRHPQPGETLIGSDPERLWGGKGANQAVAAADAGGEVAMVGAVGDDADGSAYRARLADRGIDVSGLVTVDDATTGLAIIAVDDDGENTIIVAPGANARVTDAHLDPLDALATGDVLLASLELPLDTVAAGVRARGSRRRQRARGRAPPRVGHARTGVAARHAGRRGRRVGRRRGPRVPGLPRRRHHGRG